MACRMKGAARGYMTKNSGPVLRAKLARSRVFVQFAIRTRSGPPGSARQNGAAVYNMHKKREADRPGPPLPIVTTP